MTGNRERRTKETQRKNQVRKHRKQGRKREKGRQRNMMKREGRTEGLYRLLEFCTRSLSRSHGRRLKEILVFVSGCEVTMDDEFFGEGGRYLTTPSVTHRVTA
jgi:hypothetical protein